MKNSWTKTFRRLAAGAIVAGATAFSSAMCYAQIAHDDASDPVYAAGWNAGQNGGFGFTAWNFDSNYWYNGIPYAYHPGLSEIDNGLQGGTQFSNPHNNINRAWATALVDYQHPNDPPGTFRRGFPRHGRGLVNPLGINETLKIVIDNPSSQVFYKGFTFRLNSDTTTGLDGNRCNQGRGCSDGVVGSTLPKLRWEIFNFPNAANPEPWLVEDAAGGTDASVTNLDSAAGGMELAVTRTGTDTYSLTMTPLANPGAAYTQTGSFMNPGTPVNWIELQFWNDTASDTTPTLAERGTDFYIRSMTVVPEPGTFGLLVLGAGTLLTLASSRRRKEE